MVQLDNRWLDCKYSPDSLTAAEAQMITGWHRHPPGDSCVLQIAALAYLSEPASGDEWE